MGTPWRRTAARRFSALAISLWGLSSSLPAIAALPPEVERGLARVASGNSSEALGAFVIGVIAARPELREDILARVIELAPSRAGAVETAVAAAFPLPESKSPQTADSGQPTAPSPQDPIEPYRSIWSGRIHLGGGADYGPVDRQRLTSGVALRNERGPWRHDLSSEVDFLRDESETLRRDFEVEGQSRYEISSLWFAFAKARYEDDSPSPFGFVANEIAGLGYRVAETPTFTFDLQGGPGLRQARISETGELTNDLIGSFGSSLSWSLSEGTHLTNDTELLFGSGLLVLESDTALSVHLIAELFAEFSVDVKKEQNLPGVEPETEVKTAVSLVYAF